MNTNELPFQHTAPGFETEMIKVPGDVALKINDQFIELSNTVNELREALAWCGASPDFGEGGQAEKGWNKICRPLLNAQGGGGGFVE